jgi:seryl-tRNA synthetase
MSDQARLQEIHTELTNLKRRRKELAESIKDELAQHERYQALIEELTALKEEKKGIEATVREASPKEAAEFEDLKTEIKAQLELLSDLAMNLIMAEESVELVDDRMNRYTPVLVVRFKRDGYADGEGKTPSAPDA